MLRTRTLERLNASVPAIAPSMLKCDFGNLHREFEMLARAGTDVIHFDVMDGQFVPNLSYGAMVIERVRPMSQAVFDAHLMISEPERYVDTFLAAGCEAITVHLEAVRQPIGLLTRIRNAEAVAGLAINPGTPVEDLLPFAEFCDLILVMSVDPGFGGQTFQPAALTKLQHLRKEISGDILLSVDGGIGPDNIGDAAAAGAGLFVAGSSIFDTDDYGQSMRGMKSRAMATSDPTSAES